MFVQSVHLMLTACLFAPITQALRPRPLLEMKHDSLVSCAVFAPDGKTLASGSHDNTIRLWDAATGKEIRRLNKPAPDERGAFRLVFFPGGKEIASVSIVDGRVRFWNVEKGGASRPALQLHGTGHSVVLTRDGKRLLANSSGGPALVWDIAIGAERREFFASKFGSGDIAVSPDGRTVATCGFEQGVRLWAATGEPLAMLHHYKGWVRRVAFSPDGLLLAVALDGLPGVLVWEIASGERVFAREREPSSQTDVTFTPDGRFLLASGERQCIHILDLQFGKWREVDPGHAVCAIRCSPDGTRVATSGCEGAIRIWDRASLVSVKEERRRAPTPDELARLWSDLNGDNAELGYRALWALAEAPAEAPAEAVALVKERLRPVKADAERIARLVKELGDERFAVRERAARDLEGLGKSAEPALRAALQGTPLEVQRRAALLLGKLKGPGGAWVGLVRAVTVLEKASTPAARRLLEEYARGPNESAVTHLARAALDRLNEK